MSNSLTNNSRSLSLTTAPGAAAYMTTVLAGALHRGKSFGNGTEPALERVSPRCIKNGDLDAGAFAIHLGQDRIETECVTPHVGLDPNLGIDRNHIGLPARFGFRNR